MGRPRKRWTADVGTRDSPIPWSDDDENLHWLKPHMLQCVQWTYVSQWWARTEDDLVGWKANT
jgi:hypothetical protein